MMTQNQRTLALYTVPAALLLMPLIAMQFTKEVDWSGSDFIIGGILLFGTAGVIDLVLRNVKTAKNRIIFSLLVLAVLFLVWAELAVGVFGTPFAGS
ncbi:hypothetical protein [Chryseobacterium sp. HSC-36S06]|uniref:hypothetical protein n=1 Tax=Chryseobacterium sp. HSC-36S06 TaxID=2910970 RepID=UPI00209D21E5|nr:hypothetical protein [Chryseobacterium sp. HSC-36S06]MCP2037824.1 hypothetical protein [Chryseobacterium sp. HSC-36S06]